MHMHESSQTRKYTSFLNKDGHKSLSNDPTKWSRDDYDDWIDNLKGTTNPTTPVTTTVKTTADTDLQSWRRACQDAKDGPLLEVDEYYSEWHTKMVRQLGATCKFYLCQQQRHRR